MIILRISNVLKKQKFDLLLLYFLMGVRRNYFKNKVRKVYKPAVIAEAHEINQNYFQH